MMFIGHVTLFTHQYYEVFVFTHQYYEVCVEGMTATCAESPMYEWLSVKFCFVTGWHALKTET